MWQGVEGMEGEGGSAGGPANSLHTFERCWLALQMREMRGGRTVRQAVSLSLPLTLSVLFTMPLQFSVEMLPHNGIFRSVTVAPFAFVLLPHVCLACFETVFHFGER